MPEAKALKIPHNLILEDRKKLAVSGVQDVDCFDESTVVLFTNMGKLLVRGNNLHVNAFDMTSGEFSMEGDIAVLEYSDEPQGKVPFLRRLFR